MTKKLCKQQRWQQRKLAQGLCITCGRRKIAKRSKSRCATCLQSMRDSKRK